jgi:hypothetical protein
MPLSDEQHAAVDGFLAETAPDDAPFLKAILTAGERSDGNPQAESTKGARGLMQLTPIALKDVYEHTGDARFNPATFNYDDPVASVQGGAAYAQLLRDTYGFTNPLQRAAAYDAGPDVVKDAVAQGGIDYLPAETRGYVARMAAALGPDAAPPADTTAPTAETPVAAAPSAARSPDPRMPLVTDALAGEGDRRMPLVTEALAGEGVPSHPLTDLLDRTRAEGAARMSPEGFARMDVAAPLLLPGGASLLGAGVIGGGYAGLDQTIQKIRTKGIANLDATDYRTIGTEALKGAAVGMTMHGVANLIFGKPAPARRQAEDVLTTSGGPVGLPQRPPIPVDAPSGAALAGRVEDLIQTNIPTATPPQVTDAYDAFKAETRGRPINVTKYNETLAHYGGDEFLKARQAASDRLFTPVGNRVTTQNRLGRVTGVQWFTTAEDLLKSENGIAEAARATNVAGKPDIESGLMKAMRGDLKTALLTQSLTGPAADALARARTLSAEFHQANEARKLLDQSRDVQGVMNPSGLGKKLVDRPEFYRDQLGDQLYEQMKTLTQAGATLSKVPGGREAFGDLALRAVAALGGYLTGASYGPRSGIGGAISGFALGPRLINPRLFGPHTMTIVEQIARSRSTAGAVPEALGRLAVSFAMDPPTETRLSVLHPLSSIDALLAAHREARP